jgi:hypothetical protein
MSSYQMRPHVERIRALPLPAVLQAAGATVDRHDPARWHSHEGVISVTGCKFFNWNRDTGGGGAIDLVIHLYGLDFQGALAWLCGHFPRCECIPPPPSNTGSGSELKLPAAHPDRVPRVERYLVAQRRIHPDPVRRLIKSGDLYADRYSNAVFVLRGQDHIPVGAELRGTGPRAWRGMAPGSRKNGGYFSVREANVDGIILTESAIDALSCSLVHPHRWCISTAGARSNPAWMPTIISRRLPVYCGFDADTTGDEMAEAMIERYPVIKRLRPAKHDWNDMLTPRS